jgi:hypothetical protein
MTQTGNPDACKGKQDNKQLSGWRGMCIEDEQEMAHPTVSSPIHTAEQVTCKTAG